MSRHPRISTQSSQSSDTHLHRSSRASRSTVASCADAKNLAAASPARLLIFLFENSQVKKVTVLVGDVFTSPHDSLATTLGVQSYHEVT